jgi:hypothetical protein
MVGAMLKHTTLPGGGGAGNGKKSMGCRVKPGNDDVPVEKAGASALSVVMRGRRPAHPSDFAKKSYHDLYQTQTHGSAAKCAALFDHLVGLAVSRLGRRPALTSWDMP